MPRIHTDEATVDDKLGRRDFVQVLQSVVLQCETPLVIGVFGDWGTGKTSLLRMIQASLLKNGVKTVWFDAWLHHDDEWPPVAMLQTLVSEFALGTKAKKLLSVAGTGLLTGLLKVGSGFSVSASELKNLGETYEQEMFEAREKRIRLRERFLELVELARTRNDERIVFFIDDLDRCSADAQIRMLDALRLYLNLPNCVFVIAADRWAIQKAIATKLGKEENALSGYLDKIIQLPFTVPPAAPTKINEFTAALLPESLRECSKMIVSGIGANARSLKRFINILSLHHELALGRGIHAYDPRTLCVVLLVQYLDFEQFAVVCLDSQLFHLYLADADKHPNSNLRRTLKNYGGRVPRNFLSYVHLAESTGVDLGEEIGEARELGNASKRERAQKPRSLFLQSVTPSPELAKIVGDKPQPRTELTKKLWAYIKKHGLQDKKNPRIINADGNLKMVLGGKERVSMFDMTKLVSAHLS